MRRKSFARLGREIYEVAIAHPDDGREVAKAVYEAVAEMPVEKPYHNRSRYRVTKAMYVVVGDYLKLNGYCMYHRVKHVVRNRNTTTVFFDNFGTSETMHDEDNVRVRRDS